METFNLHLENCKIDECVKFVDYSHNYMFEYGYKTHDFKVNSCFHSWSGTQHSLILDTAIKKIIIDKGIEYNRYRMSTHIHKGSYPYSENRYKEYQFEKNEVIELVSEGGFSYKYCVVHNIDDLDLTELLSMPLIKYSRKHFNICHLADRLGYSQKRIDNLNVI